MAAKSVKSVVVKKVPSGGQYVTTAANALRKPGLARSTVFGATQTARLVYAYSVNPNDPSKLIRESKDGAKQVGRLVNGKFRVAKAA